MSLFLYNHRTAECGCAAAFAYGLCVDVRTCVFTCVYHLCAVGHEAKIGSISDDTVFYLMSRGMSEEDARALIVSGFADNVSKELPLEYAVEMNNLIRLEMKGSIG